jgi:hypothetical protein
MLLPCAGKAQGTAVPDAAQPAVILPSVSTSQFFALNASGTLLGATSNQDVNLALNCPGPSGFAAPTSASPLAFDEFNRILYYAGTNGGSVKAVGIGAPYHGTNCGSTPPLTLAGHAALRVVDDQRHHSAFFLTTFGAGGPDVLTQINTNSANDYTLVGSLTKTNQVSLDSGGSYTSLLADSDGAGFVAATELRTSTSAGGLWVYSPGTGHSYKILGPGGIDLPAVNAFLIPNPRNNGGSLLVLANQDSLDANNIFNPPTVSTIFTIIDLGQLRDLIGTAATASSITLPTVTTIQTGASPYAIFGAAYDPVARKLYSLQGGGTSTSNTYTAVVSYDAYNPGAPSETTIASLSAVPLTFGSLPAVAVDSAARRLQLLTASPNAAYTVDVSGTISTATATQIPGSTFSDPNFDPTYLASNPLAGETYFASTSGNVDVLTRNASTPAAGLIDILAPDVESAPGVATNIALVSTFPVSDAALSTTNITITATASSNNQSFPFATVTAPATADLPHYISGTFPAADTYTLVASFPGDSVYSALTSAPAVVAVGVAPYNTSLNLTASATSATQANALVNLVGSTYTPGGTITISDAQTDTVLGTKTLNGALAIPISIPFTYSTTQSVFASYSGDANNSSSSSAAVSLNAGGSPAITVAPAALNFVTAVNTPSSQNVTITNSGTGTLNINNIYVSSISTFTAQSHCGASLAPAASCSFDVTFTPATAGNFSGQVTIGSNAPLGDAIVTLTGSAQSSAVSLTPGALTFTSTLGTTSAYQNVVLLNAGAQALAISSITVDNAAFAQINGCPSSLVAGTQCTIRLNFTPTQTGTINAHLIVTDNASGSPRQVSLTGTAVAPIVLSASTTTFSNSVIGTSDRTRSAVTLTNNTSSAIAIPSAALSDSTNFEVLATTCSSQLAAGASCTYALEFHPTTAGAHSSNFTVTTSASALRVNVSGTGIDVGQCPDADGDKLCDDWEQYGVVVRANNTDHFIDLPAMGASVQHKDIFLHIDWMKTASGVTGAHTHQPLAAAMATIVTSFANAPIPNVDGTTGIHLHIDCGGCFTGTGAINGIYSLAESVPETAALDPTPYDKTTNAFSWTLFDTLATDFQNSGHAFIFHHVLFAHDQHPGYTSSGLSRNGQNFDKGASDLIVSLGSWDNSVGTANQQAGTLMHELGHNLALHHGGQDDDQYKPNYLSVMNYYFQTIGVITNGANNLFDYSENALPTIYENNLNETTGLNDSGTTYPAIGPLPAMDKVGTQYYCPGDDTNKVAPHTVAYQKTATNFDCDTGSVYSPRVTADINADGGSYQIDLRTPHPYYGFKDWVSLVFSGGSIAGNGIGITPDASTVSDTFTQDSESLTNPLTRVTITSPGTMQTAPGSTITLSFVVTNTGQSDDTYALTAGSVAGWANATVTPATLTLASRNSQVVNVTYTVPASAVQADADTITLTAASTKFSGVRDSAQVQAIATTTPAPFAVSVAAIDFGTATRGSSSGVRSLLITNTGGSALPAPGIATTAEFVQSNNCGLSLAAGTSCVIGLTFTPSTIGTRTGSLSITAGSGAAPTVVSLTGTSATPQLLRPDVTLNVVPAATSTGQNVTMTVKVVQPSGSTVPTGTVAIHNLDVVIGTIALDASGNGTLSVANLAAGTYDLLATYSGDATYLSANAPDQTLTLVSAAPSTVTLAASAAVIPTGGAVTLTASIPASSGGIVPTGIITFSDGATVLGTGALDARGAATFIATALADGAHSLTASYAGDAVYAASTSAAIGVTVGTITPTVSLSTSASTLVAGASVTFTATLSSPNGAPTGTVSFLEGTAVLGTGILNGSGLASFSTSTLPIGTHAVVARYAANGIYAAATSSPASVVVTAVPDFSVAASPATLTVTRGVSGSATFNVTPVNGYAGTLRFSCGNLPTQAVCTFSPTQLTFTSAAQSAQSTTLTLDTRQHAALQMPNRPGSAPALVEYAGLLFTPCLLGLAFVSRRRNLRSLANLSLSLAMLVGFVTAATGCASGPATVAPGTYNTVITVTDGATSHAINYTVTVN